MGAQHTHRPFSTYTHQKEVIPDRVAPPPAPVERESTSHTWQVSMDFTICAF